MRRIKLTIEYDGTGLVGWQRQNNGHSVQSRLEEAIEKYCTVFCPVFASGRTDAGVHALGQVAHFDLPRDHEPDQIRAAINFHLKDHAISVLSAEIVDDDFHARFSCKGRSYLFRIINRPAPLALELKRAWWVPRPLDAEAMHDAAQVLVGLHDFTSFRATACQALSPIKTLDRLDVTRQGEVIEIRTSAKSFLHHQVRNMVGTLHKVGLGHWTRQDVQNALDARKRAAAGATAPSTGLYFLSAHYD